MLTDAIILPYNSFTTHSFSPADAHTRNRFATTGMHRDMMTFSNAATLKLSYSCSNNILKENYIAIRIKLFRHLPHNKILLCFNGTKQKCCCSCLLALHFECILQNSTSCKFIFNRKNTITKMDRNRQYSQFNKRK